MRLNGLGWLKWAHTVFEILMWYLKDTQPPSLKVFSSPSILKMQRLEVSQTHTGACADPQRAQMNNCFHPEIKVAQFHRVCVESLCFPLRLFIHPSANNGQLTTLFFRESVFPLSQSLNLLAGLFSLAVSSGEILCPEIIYRASSPPSLCIQHFHPAGLRSGPRLTESIRFRFFWGGGDRCECLRRVGGQRQQPAVCVI